MLGTVQGREFSKKGSLKLKIEGKWMFVGRCNVDGIDTGAYVEYDTNTFGDRGNLIGLQAIRVVPRPQNAAPAQSNGHAVPASNSGIELSPLDDSGMRFISNIVGSAITAGTLKDPVEVEKWTMAALGAFRALMGRTLAREPGEDDDDPNESENPAPQGNTGTRW
jgi:hypothetical protein